MSRTAGVIIFAVGLVLLVLGILNILPGVIGTGAFACFIGALVFGLSFIKGTEAGADAPPALSPLERIAGLFYEPSGVFRNLRYHPRWLAPLLIIAIFGISAGIPGIIYQSAFTQRLTPEVIAGTAMDKVVEGGFIPADKAAQIKEQAVATAKAPAARVTTPLNQAGLLFIYMLILAALLLLGVTAFGGRIDFWQSLAVATSSSLPPAVLQGLLSLVLLYIKSPDDIDPLKGQRGLARADLGLLFSPADHPYLHAAGSLIGILSLYGWWLTATGLQHTGVKVSTTTAWTVALLLLGLGIVLVLALAALFPTFAS